MKIKAIVSTPRLGSDYSIVVEVDDEQWDEMSVEDREEFVWQEVTNTITYDWWGIIV